MAAVGKSAGAAPIAELVRGARRNLLAVERFRVRKQSNRLTTNRSALGDRLPSGAAAISGGSQRARRRFRSAAIFLAGERLNSRARA